MTLKNKTERLYYHYASALPFGAEILELRPSGANVSVLLDKTIFYPEGGGQGADRGTVNGVPLLDTREKDGDILHIVSAGDAKKLNPGPAELILDSRRRRDLTVLHTGQHLLSGTVLRLTGRPTVSMHLGDEICTIDVASEPRDEARGSAELDEETLTAIEETIADIIEENHPVIIHLCPPENVSAFPLRKIPPSGEEQIRVVEIEGNDFSPCCGTHLKSTGEIGMLRILGAEKYKGMTRVSFIAGRRVLRDSRNLRQNAGVVSRALSIPLGETGRGILDFMEKTALSEKKLKVLEEKNARYTAEALLRKIEKNAGDEKSPEPPVVVESYGDAGIDEVLSAGRIAQKQTPAALVLASEPDCKFAAFCASGSHDLRSLLKETLESSGGRGGGSASFFQGNFGTKEALAAFLARVKNSAAMGSDFL